MRKIFSLLFAALMSATMFAATYTVAGDQNVLGSNWDTNDTQNEMAIVAGVYTLTKTDLTLSAGNYEYKVVKDHDWNAMPIDNQKLNIAEDGVYDVTFTFDESVGTSSINATATKKGSAVIEKHYLVVGEGGVVNGDGWETGNADNLMTTADEGLTYTLTITGLELSARDYEYKIVEKGSWTAYYDDGAGNNAKFNIAAAGVYTITYTYTVATSKCVVTTTKTADLHIVPTAAAKGSWDSWAAEVAFVTDSEEKTATGEIELTAGTDYEFKIIVNGQYRGNGYTYHRDYTGAEGISENGNNMVLQADVTGKYVITWTFATNAVQITFPSTATAVDNTAVDAKAVKVVRDGMLLIEKNGVKYTISGSKIR